MTAAAAAAAALTVTLSPAVAHPAAQVHVRVTGVDAGAALVVLDGGVSRGGRWLGWVPLARSEAGWSGVLRTPSFYGVYPVRVRLGGRVYPTRETLEIVPPRFASQPGFDTPTQVAQWWAWLIPGGAAVKSIGTWRAGFYTHRDPTLNRLLRVTVQLFGDWPARHLRRGTNTLYLSVARLRPGAPWRLLEVVRAP